MNASANFPYENNLRLLSNRKHRIGNPPENETRFSAARIFPAESGDTSLEISLSAGRSKLIHSAVDPREEARSWAQMQNTAADIFMLLGMGLGYPALALLADRQFSGKLLVVEKDMNIFQQALRHCDLQFLLDNKNAVLFIGAEAEDLKSYLREESDTAISYGWYGPAAALYADYYEEIGHFLDYIIFSRRSILNPALAAGLETLFSVMKE